MYYVYILRCMDNSLYTGITNDFIKRYHTHFSKGCGAAKYTRSRQVVGVAALWEAPSKSFALKLEIRIKKLTKSRKEALVANPGLFAEFFKDLEDVYKYTPFNMENQ